MSLSAYRRAIGILNRWWVPWLVVITAVFVPTDQFSGLLPKAVLENETAELFRTATMAVGILVLAPLTMYATAFASRYVPIERNTFWQRNRDVILSSLLTGIVVAIASVVITKILSD